jgi:hypothetical protein
MPPTAVGVGDIAHMSLPMPLTGDGGGACIGYGQRVASVPVLITAPDPPLGVYQGLPDHGGAGTGALGGGPIDEFGYFV